MRHLIDKGVGQAQNIQDLITHLDKFIAAILIGNNFVNIAISTIITAGFVYFIGYQWGVIVSTFVSSFFVLTLCEITPKILATKYSEKIALISSPIILRFIRIFHPVIRIFTGISNLILRLVGIKPLRRSPLITEEELRLMIEVGRQEGVVTDEEKRMLHRIFEFGDTRVDEVMVSIDKIVSVDISVTPEQLLDTLVEQGHSRIPVYQGSRDNIVGIIYTHDLLYIQRNRGLIVMADLLQAAYFVEPSRKVNELLRNFQLKKLQIAIVSDKGRALGLVTLEDLLEEIVGEIEEV